MSFGDNIVEYRKKVKLSQDELANKLGVTRQTISNWELNITYPDVKQLMELSSALFVDYTCLISDCFKNTEIESLKDKVLNDIKGQIDEDKYEIYFSLVKFYGVENNNLNLASGRFQKNIIKNEYEEILINTFNKYSTKKIIGINYIVDDNLLY